VDDPLERTGPGRRTKHVFGPFHRRTGDLRRSLDIVAEEGGSMKKMGSTGHHRPQGWWIEDIGNDKIHAVPHGSEAPQVRRRANHRPYIVPPVEQRANDA